MGLHRHSGLADDAFRAYVDRVRPPVVKFLDPGDDANALAGWCKAKGVESIGRNVFDDDGQALGGDGLERAIHDVVGLAYRCPNILYWELYNEAFDEPGQMARYAAASIEFMAEMERIGRKGVIGCFAQGTPEVTGDDPSREWAEFKPAVDRAIVHGHVLGLHEYSGPFMDFEETWHCLRYRRSLDILKGLGTDVERLRIFITESGIDDVWGRPGPLGKGYKPFQGTPWDRPPLSTHGDYAGQLLWYGGELSRDKQIAGWTDFGWADASGKWGDFDLSTDPPMLERVTTLQMQLPGASAPTPIPPRPPEVTMLEGIDVSRWQGVMDWARAKQAGAAYAWIKASQGTGWTDPQWARNAAGAAANGIPFGPYHYYENAADPVLQAQQFARVCGGIDYRLPPALDLEDTTTPLDESAFSRFAAEVEKLMGRPVIYTASWFVNSYVNNDLSHLSRLPLWQAAYVAGLPPTCAPWPAWTVWQYTSKGPGPAFGAQSQYIDRNRFKGTLAELLALRVPPGPTPVPPPVIDWAGLLAHAEHEQEIRGIHLNPQSALLAAVQHDGLEVVLGETTYNDHGTDRVYVVGESLDLTRKKCFVWDSKAGQVVAQDMT